MILHVFFMVSVFLTNFWWISSAQKLKTKFALYTPLRSIYRHCSFLWYVVFSTSPVHLRLLAFLVHVKIDPLLQMPWSFTTIMKSRPAVSAQTVRAQVSTAKLASEKNRRLSEQMERRPAVEEALGLKHLNASTKVTLATHMLLCHACRQSISHFYGRVSCKKKCLLWDTWLRLTN